MGFLGSEINLPASGLEKKNLRVYVNGYDKLRYMYTYIL